MTRIYSGYIKSAYIYMERPFLQLWKNKNTFYVSSEILALFYKWALLYPFKYVCYDLSLPHLFSACTLTCPVNSLLPQVHGTIGTMELGETKPASGCVRGRFQIHLGYIPKTGSWRSWYGFLVPFQAGFTSSPKYFSVYWVNRLVKGLVHGFKSKEPCFIWS